MILRFLVHPVDYRTKFIHILINRRGIARAEVVLRSVLHQAVSADNENNPEGVEEIPYGDERIDVFAVFGIEDYDVAATQFH